MMNIKTIPSLLIAMVFGLATYPAHATIHNSLSHENYVMAELETSEGSAMTHSAMRSDVKSKFEELNKMIEPAAGETAEHAEKMHDTHHGAVDSAHDTMDAHHGEGAHGAYDAHHGDEHGSGGLPQFDPTWFASQIFWLAVTFAFLYLFFAKKALPDIASALDARETRIRTDIETAEKINEQAEQTKEEYETILSDSKSQSSDIIAETQDELKAKANASIDAFRANQEKVTKDLEAKITNAKKDALSEMHSVAADAAKEAASKIIDVDADIKAVKSVVQKVDKAA